MNRTVVLIASPPRSASSALSRMVHAMGFDLGVSQTTVKDRHNERGYFENSRLLKFHTKMIGGHVFDPANRVAEIPDFGRATQDLACILTEEFGESGRILIKDPRIFQIPELYCAAMHLLPDAIDLKIIHIWRSCEASAASLKKFNRRFAASSRGVEIWRGYHMLIADAFSVFADEFPTRVLPVPLIALTGAPGYMTEIIGQFLDTNIPSASDLFEPSLLHNGT